MNKYATLACCIMPVVFGFIVMFAWIFDVDSLKHIVSGWPTMKFTTALSFFLSGIILFCTYYALNTKTNTCEILLAAPTFLLLLIMATPLASMFVGVNIGIEDIFMKDQRLLMHGIPARPSIGTMLNFLVIAIAGILTMLDLLKIDKVLQVLGVIIIAISSSSIFGYVIGIEQFYYVIEGYSSGMAIHTSINFILLGIGFLLTGNHNKCPLNQN